MARVTDFVSCIFYRYKTKNIGFHIYEFIMTVAGTVVCPLSKQYHPLFWEISFWTLRGSGDADFTPRL